MPSIMTFLDNYLHSNHYFLITNANINIRISNEFKSFMNQFFEIRFRFESKVLINSFNDLEILKLSKMIVVMNELFLFLTIVKAFAFELMAFIQKLL
jgi:hypothetical protein